MNEESGAPGGSGASDHSPKGGFEPQQGDQRSHYHQHQHQHQQEVSGEGRAEKGEEPAEAARGIESMASTGTDTAAAAPGHVEPDRAHRLEQPHQLVGEKARGQHARRGTEQREAFARQEWLARQMRWRTCNALGQPTCAYAITLAVKMKPLLAAVEGLSPAAVETLRLKAGERSPLLTAALSHRAEAVVALTLVAVDTGALVADWELTWSLAADADAKGTHRPHGGGKDGGTVFTFTQWGGDNARALRRPFALTTTAPPGTYNVVLEVVNFKHPAELTDFVVPEVALRVEVSAADDPGTIAVTPPPPYASSLKPDADPGTPPLTPMTMTAHTTSGVVTVRLSRPADIVLRVGSVGGPGAGTVEADPALLVFRKDRGEAGQSLTVRLIPSALPQVNPKP